jgi:hypothetical protein
MLGPLLHKFIHLGDLREEKKDKRASKVEGNRISKEVKLYYAVAVAEIRYIKKNGIE